MCYGYQCIIKTLIAKTYVTEIKTFLIDADYIRSRCSGCILDQKDADYHKLCNSSRREYKPQYCVKDLFKKISLTNVMGAFRSLVIEVGVDFISDVVFVLFVDLIVTHFSSHLNVINKRI